MKELKKPKNFRNVITRCCLNCKRRIMPEGFNVSVCERDPDNVTLEDFPDAIVCDYFET